MRRGVRLDAICTFGLRYLCMGYPDEFTLRSIGCKLRACSIRLPSEQEDVALKSNDYKSIIACAPARRRENQRAYSRFAYPMPAKTPACRQSWQ